MEIGGLLSPPKNLCNLNNNNPKLLFTGKDQIKIVNILNTMTGYIGMKLDSKYEFIIKHVTDVLSKIVRPKEEYDEYAGDWFEGLRNNGNQSPYMSITAYVHENLRSKVPSICHIDGSARLQTPQVCPCPG